MQVMMYHSMKILSFFLLLLGLACSVDVELCPEGDVISPCICDESDDSGDLIVDCDAEVLSLADLKQALNGLSGKKNVDLMLSEIELGTVPSNFFYGIGIKKLEISHCELDSLSDDGNPALLGLEDTLEELSILGSFSEDNVPAKLQLGHMRNLKEIDLSFNAISEVSDDWFEKGPASLEYLVLSNNGIEKIGSRAFANLIYLTQLSLDGNRFGLIQRSMFPSTAEKLETLELDNNALTSIPEDLFTRMPSLTTVSLRMNGILRLDQRTWYPVWQQLQDIRLEGNPIECDSNMNWIFASKNSAFIYGKCHSPPELEGEDLQDFIDSRSRGK